MVAPCSQKFCTHLFSFHIPILVRSCLSKLVSQAQHLYLTVEKVVTVVNTVRKISYPFFSVWKQGVRRPYSRCFPGTATVPGGQRLFLLPCATKQSMFQHQSEEQHMKQVKQCHSETGGVRKIRELPSAYEVFMYIVETGVKHTYVRQVKGKLDAS